VFDAFDFKTADGFFGPEWKLKLKVTVMSNYNSAVQLTRSKTDIQQLWKPLSDTSSSKKPEAPESSRPTGSVECWFSEVSFFEDL
jgi:hypothetical protein